MPEKVSSIYPAPTISFGSRYGMAVSFNPELSLQAMRVLTEWSWLDHVLMLLFVRMLGANPIPGAAIYASFLGTATQQTALRAVAGTLGKDHARVFEVLMAMFGSVAKDRNKIAHWLWGYASAIPDAILLIDRKRPATASCTSASLIGGSCLLNFLADTWTLLCWRRLVGA